MSNDLAYIHNLIQNNIPIASETGMKISLVSLSETEAEVTLPITPSMNDKGTAFAGAIFSAMVLTGWALSMKQALDYYQTKSVWAASTHSTIRYYRPITADSLIQGRLINRTVDARNRLKILVKCEIMGADGKKQVAFSSTYVAAQK